MSKKYIYLFYNNKNIRGAFKPNEIKRNIFPFIYACLSSSALLHPLMCTHSTDYKNS